MISSRYTVKLSDTARTVYCELFRLADAEGSPASSELQQLDEALNKLPLNAKEKKFQLAGKFSTIYRQKTISHCFTYRPDDQAGAIFVIEISPLVNGTQNAHALLEKIVAGPQHKEARAALGIPEKAETIENPPIN